VLRAKGDLKEFVEKYLKENEILLDDIEPSILVSKLWTGDKDYISTNDVYEPFLRYTSLEMITGKDDKASDCEGYINRCVWIRIG